MISNLERFARCVHRHFGMFGISNYDIGDYAENNCWDFEALKLINLEIDIAHWEYIIAIKYNRIIH